MKQNLAIIVMKKVVLKQFCKNGEQYTVALGNGTVHTFNSKRTAVNYLNKTNKFLTIQLFEIHGIYMAMWQEYQRCWFYFGYGKDKGRWSLHSIDQRKCAESLQECEGCLASAIDRSDYENGNRFSFQHIRIAINALKQSCKILIPLHQKRSNTADIYRINSFITRMVEIENKINSYGQLEAIQHTLDFKTKTA